MVAALTLLAVSAPAYAAVSFTSPGFPPTRMDDQGRLIEDWGAVGIHLAVDGAAAAAAPKVEAVKLEGGIPAARGGSQCGPVAVSLTAFRAPAFPAGVDVLTVRLQETKGSETAVQLGLDLPETVRFGANTVTMGGRAVIGLPPGTRVLQQTRDWGWADDAVALPGWGHPAVECDPAFTNIRAGLGGVPILYRFKVEPKSSVTVVLGFCESHWSQAGQRLMLCQVEGAPSQTVDPIARWGHNKPGALRFAARHENGDGQVELAILPVLGAPDQNPILSALWLFPAGANPELEQVIAGRLNGTALRYVDVGGSNDQSLYAGGTVEYALKLPAGGAQEMTFLVACPGASVPAPGQTAWTSDKLRQAATAVWSGWRE